MDGGGRQPAVGPGAGAARARARPRTTRGRAVTALAAADPATPAILLRQAAVVVALSTRVGQLGPAEVRAAQRDLFEEEEGYWRKTAAEVVPPRPGPAGAALGPGHRRHRRPWTAGQRRRHRAAPGAGAGAGRGRPAGPARRVVARPVRQGRASRPTPAPRLPSWLADRMPGGTDRTGISWTVAALNVDRQATSTLAQLAIDVHRDVWLNRAPAARDGNGRRHRAVAHRAAPPVGRGRAGRRGAGLAHPGARARAGPTWRRSATPSRTRPGRCRRTAIVLARRQLDGGRHRRGPGRLMLTLGARYSELGAVARRPRATPSWRWPSSAGWPS